MEIVKVVKDKVFVAADKVKDVLCDGAKKVKIVKKD